MLDDQASFYRVKKKKKKHSKPIINTAKNPCVEAIHGIKGNLKTASDASYDYEQNGSLVHLILCVTTNA